jgi:hypothetical protein
MTRTWRHPLLAGALMLLAQFAHAQYSWIDDKGTRVFSDRPPPPGTPAARILKGPRTALAAPADGAAVSAAVPAASAPAAPRPPTLAEQDAAFRQRQAKREDDTRKQKESGDRQAEKEERCAAARQQERLMTSGERVSGIDAKGERYFLTDAEKAQRLNTARKALQDCR